MRRIPLTSFLLTCLAGPLLAVQEPQPATSSEPQVIERFLSRQDEPPARYRAVRRIEAGNPRFDLHGWMEALTEVTTDGQFRYQVLREGGSEYILRTVLRPLLRDEEKLLAAGHSSRAAVTPENYHLRGLEAAEPGVLKLVVKPKRRDVFLVDGAVFVTADEADLVRVEGTLAKNPSFWTKRVHVVRHYQRIGGARVPTRLDSVAQIRFAGTATLSMTWAYETINGEPVSAAAASAGARSAPAEMP